MPKQTAKSSLAARLGAAAREAVNEHRTDETSYGGGGDLPAGIEGGVAQLVSCGFGQFKTGKNQGKDFFMAAGIVVQPKEVNGISIEGLRTQIGPEPLCDTPDRQSRPDVDSHIAWVLNELRKLGVDTAELDLEDFESTCETLVEQKPYFRFRTWAGQATDQYPNPRTNHEWRGITDYTADEDDSGVVDETAEAEEPEKPAKPDKSAKTAKPSKAVEDEEASLEELAERADGDDVEAQETLTKMAKKVGVDAESAESWAAVAEAIGEASADEGGGEGEDGGEAEEWAPEVGEVYPYKPMGKRKPVDCEVTAVFAGKQTVTLKNLDDEKSYKSVPWSKLERDE